MIIFRNNKTNNRDLTEIKLNWTFQKRKIGKCAARSEIFALSHLISCMSHTQFEVKKEKNNYRSFSANDTIKISEKMKEKCWCEGCLSIFYGLFPINSNDDERERDNNSDTVLKFKSVFSCIPLRWQNSCLQFSNINVKTFVVQVMVIKTNREELVFIIFYGDEFKSWLKREFSLSCVY